jgi:hypothetical protein
MGTGRQRVRGAVAETWQDRKGAIATLQDLTTLSMTPLSTGRLLARRHTALLRPDVFQPARRSPITQVCPIALLLFQLEKCHDDSYRL